MTDEEREEEREETGWKLVHADVFRPPLEYPMLFCVSPSTLYCIHLIITVIALHCIVLNTHFCIA
jgi:transmembrane 9 superfamily member 2/4